MSDAVSSHERQPDVGEPQPGVVEALRAGLQVDRNGHLVPADLSDPGDGALDSQDPPYWGEWGGPAPSGDALATVRAVVAGVAAYIRARARQAADTLSNARAAAPAENDSQQHATVGHYNTSASLAAHEQDVARYGEGWREFLASEGTRARYYQLIRRAEPELSDQAAWGRATKQAYDDLAERCPDGNLVPSDHPWDREYVRQSRRIMAEREAALAAVERNEHALHERLLAVQNRRADYVARTASPDESILAIFDQWSRSISADRPSHDETVAATQMQYRGQAIFDRAVAATNHILQPDIEEHTYEYGYQSRRIDQAEQWESDPFRPDFERAKRGLLRVWRALRGVTPEAADRVSPVEEYWQIVGEISQALLDQGQDDAAAYQQAQHAAIYRMQVHHTRDVVATLPGADLHPAFQ